MIDTSSLPKIGNMTQGAGLASIFDGDPATAGRKESTSGWAGVDMSASPKSIARVEVTPPSNGFDASGLTTGITLSLRAKNGSAPSGPFDGVELGSQTFQDENAQTTRTIYSSQITTHWEYVWVAVSTGVWSIISELNFYEPSIAVEPAPSDTAITVYQKACNDYFPLPWNQVEVPGFMFDIAVDEPSAALIDFGVNLTHVGDTFSPQFLGPIGVGAQIVYKFHPTFEGLATASWQTPANSRTNGINIDDRNPAHYANVGLPTAMALEPGFYRFTLRMSAHTTGDSRNGLARILAEGGKGLNGLRVTVIKGGAFVDVS